MKDKNIVIKQEYKKEKTYKHAATIWVTYCCIIIPMNAWKQKKKQKLLQNP